MTASRRRPSWEIGDEVLRRDPYGASGVHSTAAVEVDFGMGPEEIPSVGSPEECNELDAWFFDDPEEPHRLLLGHAPAP